MKKKFLKVLDALAKHDTSWKILKPFAKAGRYLCAIRSFYHAEKNIPYEQIQPIFEKKEVLHGPFKGLRYPILDSVGSALYAKLLGSYEKEIHSIIEYFCKKGNYLNIIDIGCAEGYYAVGLSLRIPKATVFAYDTDEKARMLCKQMAKLNGIEEKVKIRDFLTAKELGHLDLKGSLLICDCEGWEKHLFNEKNIGNLVTCDLLIETHDFIDIETSNYLRELFSKTHDIFVIKSIDDIEKAQKYTYKETENLSMAIKKFIYAERRPAIMEWIFCKPKSHNFTNSIPKNIT